MHQLVLRQRFTRRQALSLGLGSAASIALAACSITKSGADRSVVYKIATDVSFAPFEYKDGDGMYVGIDMDLLAAIAADQGFEYELKPMRFEDALQAVQAAQVDAVMAGITITEQRRDTLDFSDPYYESTVCVAAQAGGSITSLDDLRGQTAAVKTGTISASWASSLADEYGFVTIPFDISEVMYQDVAAGNTACCFEDTTVMSHIIDSGAYQLQIVAEAGADGMYAMPYGFAVAKDTNPELLKMFNAGLANLKDNGTYDAIIAKYIQTVR